MALAWKPHDDEVYKDWIDSIVTEASDELNEWESNFVSDMQVKIHNGWKLNQNQAEKLEQIYARYTK